MTRKPFFASTPLPRQGSAVNSPMWKHGELGFNIFGRCSGWGSASRRDSSGSAEGWPACRCLLPSAPHGYCPDDRVNETRSASRQRHKQTARGACPPRPGLPVFLYLALYSLLFPVCSSCISHHFYLQRAANQALIWSYFHFPCDTNITISYFSSWLA